MPILKMVLVGACIAVVSVAVLVAVRWGIGWALARWVMAQDGAEPTVPPPAIAAGTHRPTWWKPERRFALLPVQEWLVDTEAYYAVREPRWIWLRLYVRVEFPSGAIRAVRER